MRLVIDIPDDEVPKRREIVEIGLQFMDGEVCECTYPFQILPKGHGRLIDVTRIGSSSSKLHEILSKAPTIIEADKEVENETGD